MDFLLRISCLGLSLTVLTILVGAAGLGAPRSGEAVRRWSWQEPHARVLPTGDLEWAPHPFKFAPGDSIRYVDFESGNDGRDGLTKDTAWKHHPWDPAATGQAKACAGVQTYVFKQGVVYRGELAADESGTPGAPIILTRDPAWGVGPAVLCGSEIVTAWRKGTDNALIPEPESVWYSDLDWVPRNVWMIDEDDAVKRVALARTPNWTISDPDDIKSEWWMWKNPDKPFDNTATINGQRRHLAFDPDHINANRPQDYYEGAIVWTTKGWVMGSPFPARVLAVDREQGSLAFPGQWGGGPSYKIIRGCRYYLEDKPHYRDADPARTADAGNEADAGPRRNEFAIDFLRLARGTLADSKTTIEELYAWEFDGPFLDDFTGRRRSVEGDYAGAIIGE